MTKQASIDRRSTVVVDVTKTDWPAAHVLPYRYAAGKDVGVKGYQGKHYSKKVVTTTRGTVQIEIDIEALVDWMARRALHTKSGKSNMQDGLVIATVLHTEQISKETVDVPFTVANAELI